MTNLFKHVSYRKIVSSIFSLFFILSIVSSANAQLLEEVTVTAQKREQSVQDVGISITAFSGEQLEQLGFESSIDIIAMTPGVSAAGAFAGQLLSFSVRGVSQNDFSDVAEAPTGVYIDEGYVAMMIGQQFALYDIDRVEVLKGPQGTLFGRNSTGGTVQFVTRKPTEEVEGYIDAGYGSYDQVRVEAAVSGPIGKNVSGRVAMLYNNNDGYVNNIFPDRDDEGGDETYAGRVHLLFEPNDNFSALLTGYGGESDFSTSPYQHRATVPVFDDTGQQIDSVHLPNGSPDGFGNFETDGDGLDVNKNFSLKDANYIDMYGGTANLSWELNNGLTVVSITDYKNIAKRFRLDGDVSATPFFTPISLGETTNWSEELRLHGETDRVKWIAGFYYLDIDAEEKSQGFGTFLFAPFQFLDSYTLDTESVSVFGQIEFALTDHITAIGGIRWTNEKKDYDYSSGLHANVDFPNFPVKPFARGPLVASDVITFSDKTSNDLITAKIQLEWAPTDNLMIYAGYNRGVKAGSFNAPFGRSSNADPMSPSYIPFVPSDFPYDEEILNAYEIGFKSVVFDGKARVNTAVYYYDYEDYQGFQLTGLGNTRIENYDTITYGAEIEIIASPMNGLDLLFSAALIDSEVKDVAVGSLVFNKRVAPFTPDFQFSGVARYAWPAFSGGTMAIQGDFNYIDSAYYSLTNFTSTKMDSYVLGNFKIAYTTANEKWDLSAFVRNVADERNGTVGFDISTSPCGCSEVAYGKPRWAGFNIKYNF